MKKGIIILMIVAGIGMLYYFLFGKKKSTSSNGLIGDDLNGGVAVAGAGGSFDCINPPSHLERWEDGDSSKRWGNVHRGLKEHFGYNTDEADEEVNFVLGFFKQIDVFPEKGLVLTYKQEIKKHIDSGFAKEDWLVEDDEIGELRCA